MANKQLREYVEQAIRTGAAHDEIKRRLTAHGWDVAEVDEVFHNYQTTHTNTAKPERRYLEPGDHVHIEYASFERRLAAFMIDFLILLPLSIVTAVIIISTGRDGAPIIIPIWLVTVWFYFSLQESMSTQGTFGKRLLEIYVVRSYGEAIDFRRASKRFFAKFLSILPLGIGFIWMKYNPKRQTFHDMLADTVVPAREVGPPTQKISQYIRLGLWAFVVLIICPIALLLFIIIYNLVKPTQIPQSSSNPEVTGTVTAQSRDTIRKSNIADYATALSSYYISHRNFPKSNGDTTSPNSSGIFDATGPLKGISPSFTVDPLNGQTGCQTTSIAPKLICSYHYLSNSSGTSYVLWSDLELPGSGGGVYFTDSTGAKGLLTSDPTTAP